jgi:hypothetical protein
MISGAVQMHILSIFLLLVTTTVAQANDVATECLLDWAEGRYPGLFSPEGNQTRFASPYHYRYYSNTDSYVGISTADQHVYYLGPSRHLQDVGELAAWFNTSGCLIAGRYQVVGEDGAIIRDVVNDLEWQRCSVGQVWDSEISTCLGDAVEYTQYDALELTAPGGFRLPTIAELRSLVYCSSGLPGLFKGLHSQPCIGDYVSPTIVSVAFPGIPASGFFWPSRFWSASHNFPYVPLGFGKYVDFGDGHYDLLSQRFGFYVRLVRDP